MTIKGKKPGWIPFCPVRKTIGMTNPKAIATKLKIDVKIESSARPWAVKAISFGKQKKQHPTIVNIVSKKNSTKIKLKNRPSGVDHKGNQQNINAKP
jgi:hypothetical protein